LWFLGSRETVSFLKKEIVSIALTNHIFTKFTGVQLRLFMILIRRMMTLEKLRIAPLTLLPFYTLAFMPFCKTVERFRFLCVKFVSNTLGNSAAGANPTSM
jgi:hypothetical protein